MKKLKMVLIYILLFPIDLRIYLTIGGHWKTIRRYSKNKVKEAWMKSKYNIEIIEK
jgi:hypothetical protein